MHCLQFRHAAQTWEHNIFLEGRVGHCTFLGRRAAYKDCSKEADLGRAWLRAAASLLPCMLVPETREEFSWAFWGLHGPFL